MGTYMKKGTPERIQGADIFLSVEFAMADFMGGITLCTAEDPRGPAIGWRLKPCPGPVQVFLRQYILFSMSPSTPNHAPQMPKVMKTGISQSGRLLYLLDHPTQPELVRFWQSVRSGTAKRLDDLQADVRSSSPALAC